MTTSTKLNAPFFPERIPLALRQRPRWAPWRAKASRSRPGKWDKIPCHPAGHGISTAKPDRWASFDDAVGAVRSQPGRFAGVGFCCTGLSDLVFIDLDRCVENGEPAPWAAQVVAEVGGYAELSPSGTGVRIVAAGAVPRDWCNHEQGIEVYAGHAARFLTITGVALPGSPENVVAARSGALAALSERYERQAHAVQPATAAQQVPGLADDAPEPADLDLPPAVRDFLDDGTTAGGDRSAMLRRAAGALVRAGLDGAQALTVLVNSAPAFGVALDHRRQDPDNAIRYLWDHHVTKAIAVGGSAVAASEDFDDVNDAPAAAKHKQYTLSSLLELELGDPVWWWDGYMPGGEVTLLAAHGAAGKSTLALQLACAIATGRPFLGRATRRGRVLFFSGEDPVESPHFQARVRRVLNASGVDPVEVGDRLRIEDATADPALSREVRTDAGRVAIPARGYAELREAIKAHRADVVIVDNASDTFEGDEIARAQVRAFVRSLATLVRAAGGAVLLLSHVNKTSAKGTDGDGEGYSGSTAWHNSVRSRLHLREVENKARTPDVRLLELLHGKSSHGVKLPPLALTWRKDGVPELAADADTRPDAELRRLVRVIAEFTSRGERVPAAVTGPNTARAVLGRHAPADLRDLLRDGERRGWLVRVEVNDKTTDYKPRQSWEATPEGRKNAAPAGGTPSDLSAPAGAADGAFGP